MERRGINWLYCDGLLTLNERGNLIEKALPPDPSTIQLQLYDRGVTGATRACNRS